MVDFQCKSRYDWADFLQVMALLRADGSGGVIENLDQATREMQKLKNEGYKYADKGLKICEQRKYDVEVGFYKKALKNNDMELMKKAAYNGNVDAKCIMVKYRLQHFEELQKLEAYELGHFMYDYHKSMHLKDSVSREDIQPVVDLMEDMLVDDIRYGQFSAAYHIYESDQVNDASPHSSGETRNPGKSRDPRISHSHPAAGYGMSLEKYNAEQN